MIISPAPEDFAETLVFKALEQKSNKNDDLLGKTTAFIKAARPLQELIISGPFKDYTLHNPNHSKKIMHLAGYVIHTSTLAKLSALELAVMVMSFYLHDLGMVVTQTERERIIVSAAFREFIQIKTDFDDKIQKARSKYGSSIELEKFKIDAEIFQLTEAALAEYLRPIHATEERYKELISLIKNATTRSDLFEVGDASFERELIQVCMSHNLNSSVLMETINVYTEKYPRERVIGGLALNMQYCSAVLRIVDVLDFDNERTPRSLFNSLGIQNKQLPGFEISLKEWNKHLAVHAIVINSEEIIITGDSKHPSIERSIKEFCAIIEDEIRHTQAVIKQNVTHILEKYQFNLPLLVRDDIRSIGYIYKDFSITINGSNIMKLLMGENLYIDSQVALRELIQNAIDACNVRAAYESASYRAKIQVSLFTDVEDRKWLKIIDNGVGMDEYVLSNYFLKVGNSYYSSNDFKKFSSGNQISSFTPISRFGIGLISVFMIGEAIKVTTKNSSSLRNDLKERTLFINNTESLALVTEREDGIQGTTVEVLLKKGYDSESYLKKLIGFVKENIIRPQVSVYISDIQGNETIITSENYVRLNSKSLTVLQEKSIECIQIDLVRFSNILKGKAIFFFFRQENGTLSYYDKKEELKMGLYPLKETQIFDNFPGGSRLTVNGISMRLKKIGSLYNIGKNHAAAIMDIEVKGVKGVDYDVSRDKLYGKGLTKVRSEIFRAIEKGFKELGFFDRFDEDTCKMIERVKSRNTPAEALDKDLLAKILAKLPKSGSWPEGIHKTIAEELEISNIISTRYITAALHAGLIKKGS